MDDRDKMLDVTLTQIEKQFGKGAVMKLGEHPMGAGISVIPTGSSSWSRTADPGSLPRLSHRRWGLLLSRSSCLAPESRSR